MALLSFERRYRVRGGTLIGGDLFDFWVGPIYVGFSASRPSSSPSSALRPHPLGCVARTDRGASGRSASRRRPSVWARVPLPLRTGHPLAGHHRLRARCLQLVGAAAARDQSQMGMAAHIPFAYSVAIFAYTSLVVIRPVMLGAWGTLSLRHLQSSRLGVQYGISSIFTFTTIPRT